MDVYASSYNKQNDMSGTISFLLANSSVALAFFCETTGYNKSKSPKVCFLCGIIETVFYFIFFGHRYFYSSVFFRLLRFCILHLRVLNGNFFLLPSFLHLSPFFLLSLRLFYLHLFYTYNHLFRTIKK